MASKPAALHGSECWTSGKADKRELRRKEWDSTPTGRRNKNRLHSKLKKKGVRNFVKVTYCTKLGSTIKNGTSMGNEC